LDFYFCPWQASKSQDSQRPYFEAQETTTTQKSVGNQTQNSMNTNSKTSKMPQSLTAATAAANIERQKKLSLH
jgi:hypothetical protein